MNSGGMLRVSGKEEIEVARLRLGEHLRHRGCSPYRRPALGHLLQIAFGSAPDDQRASLGPLRATLRLCQSDRNQRPRDSAVWYSDAIGWNQGAKRHG